MFLYRYVYASVLASLWYLSMYICVCGECACICLAIKTINCSLITNYFSIIKDKTKIKEQKNNKTIIYFFLFCFFFLLFFCCNWYKVYLNDSRSVKKYEERVNFVEMLQIEANYLVSSQVHFAIMIVHLDKCLIHCVIYLSNL